MERQGLSYSKVRSALTCLRLYQFKHELYREPVARDEALDFGRLMDRGLQAWWGHLGDRDETASLREALAEVRRQEGVDPFVRVKVEVLLVGYDVRWRDEARARWEVVSVEEKFSVPLRNPLTGAASRTWELRGYVDAVLRERATGDVFVREGKTTSDDLSPGSEYWTQLRMDAQVSMYYAGLAGYDPRGCLYDVVGKPGLQPCRATPAEVRKYRVPRDRSAPPRQGTKAREEWDAADPSQRVNETAWRLDDPRLLYAGQRDRDETSDEYRLRVREAVAASPERYYGQNVVVRLERDMEQHVHNFVLLGRMIRDCQLAGTWPQNPLSCRRYNRRCSYWSVCVGEASLSDPALYKDVEGRGQTVAEAAAERAERYATPEAPMAPQKVR